MHNWLLPEYIEDILSPEARRMEQLRRALLDLFHGYGFELVVPPMLEHIESLLTGTGHDLRLKTFTVVDQLSGRLLGLRADMSPQAARIDAHLLNREGVTRLCYAGPVLHTRPEGQMQKRELLQAGAELFGHAGIEADIEMLLLLNEACAATGVPAHLEIGHVAVYRALTEAAGLDEAHGQALFEALRGKDLPEVEALTRGLPAGLRDALRSLPELVGGAAMLATARTRLPALPAISRALAELEEIARALEGRVAQFGFDLGELRGYHYHSGIVFNAWAAGWPHPLARGGRYDEVGVTFGRARPATGFSMDLRAVAGLLAPAARPRTIVAPWSLDAGLEAAVQQLRAAGEVVVRELPGHPAAADADRALMLLDGRWQVVVRS